MVTIAHPRTDHGGALVAIVHYWMTKVIADDAEEQFSVPEWNLKNGGPAATLEEIFGLKGPAIDLDPTIAFSLGLELASIAARAPLDCGDKIRIAIERAQNEQALLEVGRDEAVLA